MRVAYVSTDRSVPAFDHATAATPMRELCGAMLDAGFDLTLFLANRGGVVPNRLGGVTVVDVRGPSVSEPSSREHEIVRANGDIAQALATAGPFDLIYERAAVWSVAPMHYAVKSGAVGILELHAQTMKLSEIQPAAHARAAQALLTSAFRSAHLVVTRSEEVAADVHAAAAGNVNVHVVPGGCDPRCLAQASASGGRRDFVIGFRGSMIPGSGLDTLIDAFATVVALSVPHAQLLIVGDGPDSKELVARFARRGLSDRVTIVPDADENLPALLARMDVVVAPHTDDRADVSPTVTECMAAGLPVVASATATFASVIRDNETGVLFLPGDAKGLASALGRLHADPLRRRHLGHEARAFAMKNFTWRRSLEQTLALAAIHAHR